MKIKELNKNQKRAMIQDATSEHYEWDNNGLTSYIAGEVPLEREEYRYAGREMSVEQIEQNTIIKQINEIITKYNSNMKINKQELKKLNNKYTELEKYREKHYTSYANVINGMIFNKVIMISGPGGIGKSQFLYEFSEKISKKFNYLCLYGKYCEQINGEIFTQIEKITKNNRFYFVIDAINEFNRKTRNRIYKFIKTNKICITKYK